MIVYTYGEGSTVIEMHMLEKVCFPGIGLEPENTQPCIACIKNTLIRFKRKFENEERSCAEERRHDENKAKMILF